MLMVSNYVWNEALSLLACRTARSLKPGALTIMGGPNISVDADSRIELLRRHRDVCVYVLGEGDLAAPRIVRQWLQDGCSTEKLLERDLGGCVQRRPDGSVTGDAWPARLQDIDAIPSPWLTGVMDPFFDDRLSPIIETNRGCPFTCAFCCQGSSPRGVAYFSLDRVVAEIDYIARRVKTHSPRIGTLRIADANFGMYERDLQIVDAIARAQRDCGWPRFIDATTGKNQPQRVIEASARLDGAMTPLLAVQSLAPEILRNVRRRNISLESYRQMQVALHERGMRSLSDLILGLPGESLRSHLDGLDTLLDAGTNQAHCFQAMLLKGSDLESREMRRRYSMDTRWRVLAKCFGQYDGQPVLDVEEIVVATSTLSFEDYLQARRVHLAFSIFWNDGLFQEPIELARRLGARPADLLAAMLAAATAADGPLKAMVQNFLDETTGELFPSAQACVDFYTRSDNFQRLQRGEIGDNLMYKYRAHTSFFLWKDLCAAAMGAIAGLLRQGGLAASMADFEGFWRDFHTFVRARHAGGATAEEVLASPQAPFCYDVARWLADDMPLDTAAYRHERPVAYRFDLPDEAREELRNALDVWPFNTGGLSKLVTRIRLRSQKRGCRPLATA
ncbi:MAG: radical SAM protein [Planctomycetes bacterium]|nr:radical SAM protein [Planctomycetota bacterium]